MPLASNLLELIFSLLVAVASLLGALFIIGFLLVEPRTEFEDDDHLDDFGILIDRKRLYYIIILPVALCR